MLVSALESTGMWLQGTFLKAVFHCVWKTKAQQEKVFSFISLWLGNTCQVWSTQLQLVLLFEKTWIIGASRWNIFSNGSRGCFKTEILFTITKGSTSYYYLWKVLVRDCDCIGCAKVSKSLFLARCGIVSQVMVTQACDNEARRFKLLDDFSVALCRVAFSFCLTISKVFGFTF